MTSKEKILAEFENWDLTKKEAAERVGLSYKYVSKLVNDLVYEGKLLRLDTDPTGAEIFGLAVEEEPEYIAIDCDEKGACIF